MPYPNDGLRLPPPWISPAAGKPDREVQRVITVERRRAAAPSYDPNTLLLIPGTGANNSTNIIDTSQYARSVTPFGNAKISTSVADPFGGNNGVIACDGNGDGITWTNSSVFNSGSVHSLEFHFRQATESNAMLYERGGGFSGWNSTTGMDLLVYIDSGTLYLQFYSGSGSTPVSLATAAPSVTTWNHLLESYNGSTSYLFLNGNIIGTSTSARVTPSEPNAPRMGDYSLATGYSLNGSLANIRWRNVATTAAFTPPTAPFTP